MPHVGALQPWALHWMVTQPATPLAEYLVTSSHAEGNALRSPYPPLRGVPQPDGGFIAPSERPGLGVEVDPAWLDE